MSKKILSIDDSRMVHMVVTKTLRPLDVEVLTAINGQEGLEKAEKDQPDLILLDAAMPVMDGIEALAALKANPATKNIPVVMFVAEAGHDNVEKAQRLGVLKCLPKPFTGDALVAGLSPYIDLGRKAA
jgi:CheY-like chemotaxis protein